MNKKEAIDLLDTLNSKRQLNEEEKFLNVELLEYLYRTTKNTHYATMLGGFYYGEREFKLAEKYYLIGATRNDIWACSGLGYIYYYGRVGKPDYKKAFYYYKRASDLGDFEATYKLADMYKNGYYVEKDYELYKALIERIYEKIKDDTDLGLPIPDIFVRMAHIKIEEGDKEEALELYIRAKSFLAQKLSHWNFFGDFTVMSWIIDGIYSLKEFDYDYFDFFDLYELFKKPGKVSFSIGADTLEAEAIDLDGTVSVIFDGQAYKSVDEFIRKAKYKGIYLSLLNQRMGEFRWEK